MIFFGLFPSVWDWGSDMYVGMSATAIVRPSGVPECLTPVKQQLPGGPARAGDDIVCDIMCGGGGWWESGSLR